MKPELKQYEDKIVEWATAQPLVRALIVCGSTERRVNPGDEWADLDLEIYVTDVNEFVTNPTWLGRFGAVWTHLQIKEGESPVILALYDGGEKVDFHFFHVGELQRLVEAQELPEAYLRGYRVVVDKDKLAVNLPHPFPSPSFVVHPTEGEFLLQVNAFWYGVVYVAKQIRRRNLWVVKFRDWTTTFWTRSINNSIPK